MDINDKFIQEILHALPEEGLKELNRLLDNNTISEIEIVNLLEKYNINTSQIANAIRSKGE